MTLAANMLEQPGVMKAWGELAGDRNSVRTAELAEPFREPQSGVTSPQSPALSAGEGDEI